MKSAAFLYVFITLLLIKIEQTKCFEIATNTMDFKDHLYVGRPSSGFESSGILKAGSYTPNSNKTLILEAPNGYGLLVAFKFLDLRPETQDTLKLYTPGYPQKILFSHSNSGIWRNREDYLDEDGIVVYAPGGRIAIQFTIGPSAYTFGYEGFQLTYTAQANRSKCEIYDFHCNNGRCISSVLKCDYHNHCGDRSEQENCDRIPPDIHVTYRRNVGGIVGGVVCLFIAAACAIYIIARRTRSRILTETVISHPPPNNLPSYPPSYPQPGTHYPPPPPPYSEGISNPGYYK